MYSDFCSGEIISALDRAKLPPQNLSRQVQIYFSTPSPSGFREFVPHHHTELELSYVVSGKGTYTLTDKSYTISTGDIFTFANDELHKITYISPDEPFTILNIKFLPRLIFGDNDSPEDLFFMNFFRDRDSNFSHRIDKDTKGYNQYISLFKSIVEEKHSNLPGASLLIKQYITLLLVLLSRNLTNNTSQKIHVQSEFSSRDAFYAVNKAADYIEKNFTSDIRLGELAESFAMSQNAFTGYFKALNGTTPKGYITSLRLDKAMRLLASTRLSILDIAFECGYNSTASFNKIFLKTIGKTPSEYRRAYDRQ